MIALFDGNYGEDEAYAREVEREIERLKRAESLAREDGDSYGADFLLTEIERLESK